MASAVAGIFCRSCGYDLRSLAEHRCPECGREFDPAVRRSYDIKPRRAVARWVWRGVFVLTILAGAVAALVGWTWRGFERDRVAYERLRKFGIVRKELAPMPVIERILPQRYQYLRTRVWSVCVGTKGLKEEDWQLMGRMDDLRDGRFGNISDADGGLQRVEGLKWLTELHITGKNVDDAGVVHLAQSLTKLRRLYVSSAPVGDVGIEALVKAASLEWLVLSDCGMSDKGLMALAELRSLREMILHKMSLVTDEGIARFKAARPDVKLKLLTE